MKESEILKILKETEIGYDGMAEKFSQTRKFFWRGLEFIQNYAKEGDRVLDFGCGNGRLLELLLSKVQPSENFKVEPLQYFGVDVSQKLIDIASQKYGTGNIKFSKISGSDSLPFPNNFFNSVYSIAVFHHLPKAQAQKMANELFRVTKYGGYVIITVWHLWQKKYWRNIAKNWWAKLRGDNELDWNDCYISFKNNEGKIFQRYHHAWTKKELTNIFLRAGFQIEKCEIVDDCNIILIGRK